MLIIFVKGIRGEYELIVLRPDHFLADNFPVLIKHPITQAPTTFYTSENGDGHLHEGNPTGPILPPLCSRGKIDRTVPLNPILVNYAAMIRFRRLIRQDLSWGLTLSDDAAATLREVVKLHEVVNWKPDQPVARELTFNVPGSHPPSRFYLRDWRYLPAPGGALRPSSSAPGPSQGIETGSAPTVLDRALAQMEAGEFSHIYQFVS